MIITKTYADRLIRESNATKTTTVTDDKGRTFQAIDRHDIQRVDHYRI